MNYLKKLLFGLILMMSVSIFCDADARAATLLKEKKAVCDDIEDITYEHAMKKPGVLYFIFKLKLADAVTDVSDGSQGVQLSLTGYADKKSYYWNEKPIYQDSFQMKITKNNSEEDWWFRSDPLEPGYYVMEAESLDSTEISLYYEVWQYDCFAKSAKMPKTVKLKTYSEQKIKISQIKPKNSLLGAKVSVDKKDVLDIWNDGANGIYVYGKKAGKCKLTVKLDNGKKLTCSVVVTDPAPFLNYKEVRLYTGETFNLELMASKKGVTWSSSNPKIATVDKKGKIKAKIKAKNIGNCKITANYKGKTYTARLSVILQEPNFAAYTDGYYTRDNYFVVRFRNYSNKPLTVYAKNATACNYDYKSFDRDLKLAHGAQSVTIKPGENKSFRFYVKGYTTWYDYSDFWIQYNFRFDGQQYSGRMYSSISKSDYKKGAKYYYTYWGDAPG